MAGVGGFGSNGCPQLGNASLDSLCDGLVALRAKPLNIVTQRLELGCHVTDDAGITSRSVSLQTLDCLSEGFVYEVGLLVKLALTLLCEVTEKALVAGRNFFCAGAESSGIHAQTLAYLGYLVNFQTPLKPFVSVSTP